MRHDDVSFTIEVPDGWEAEVAEETTSFYRPDDGVGAITVSTMRPPPGTTAMVEDVLALLEAPANVTRLESDTPGHAIARWDVTDEEHFLRYWVVVRPHVVASVTYTCHHTELGREVEVAEAAVRTLRLR
ncbi:MAG: hypothetical protein M9894_11555 [Planctomycetes bacterium]|nr:hypothetical protein [Planctomycetota bacterium]